MLYINKAKVRKLIGVRRVKKWIQPGETVDLDSFDVRNLGMNSVYFEAYVPEPEEKPAPPAEEPKTEEPKVDEPADSGDDEKKEPEKKEPEKKDPPKKSKKELEAEKKAAKKKEADARKALKESLTGMTKVRLIEVGEEVIGVDVKSRDTKDAIIKQLMKAAKDKGYEYVLKNS